jgi:F-type H+-transporting ATPase subunit a
VALNPLEQFVVKPLVPLQIGQMDISFTQASLFMILGVVLATALMTLSMRTKSIIPNRWQIVSEMLYEFVAGMVHDNLGRDGRKFFPLIFTIFMIVLMGNLLGMVPYSFTYTSHIAVTATLAIGVFILMTAVGLAYHGLHFFSIFLPKGLPIFLIPLIVVIEVISYLARPFSLAVRLFVNMVAGHTLLKVFAGFNVALFGTLLGNTLGLLPLFFNVAIIGLEVLIAVIQAYVFAILTCAYLKTVIELH